jgi:RNA polymerase sigma-70 factor (ECF subfamily)
VPSSKQSGAAAPEAGPGKAAAQPAVSEPIGTAERPRAPVNTQEKEASIGSGDAPSRDAADDGSDAEGARPSEPPPAEGAPLPRVVEPRTSEDRQRDLELVKRVQAGDRAAFRQLFDLHHRRAYAVAFGVLKHRQDALDVVQESFVKVHKHIASFQGTSSFYTWLYRIVMNLAIDQLRRRKTGKSVEYDDAVLKGGEAAVEESVLPRMLDQNPRKAVIRRELLAKMEAALAELPEYHRQVILLREVEGLSYEEMAEALDVPKGTIMSRLFHARRKMQTALQAYVDGDMDIEE